MQYKIKYLSEPETITLTVRQLLDAIEKNGLPQERGTFVRTSNTFEGWSSVLGACAIGQAALNLGVDWYDLESGFAEVKTKGRRLLINSIIGRNDSHGWSYKEIAEYYREKFADRLDEPVTFKVSRRLETRD
jgi:hypothetical protein